MTLDSAVIHTLPKVLLHEHLDGVLRPGAIVELARAENYNALPIEDPVELGRWFQSVIKPGCARVRSSLAA